MDKHIAIQKIAVTLDQEIQRLQEKIGERETVLNALSEFCDHPKVETYCDRRIGKCEFCLHEFMTRDLVDQIFEN